MRRSVKPRSAPAADQQQERHHIGALPRCEPFISSDCIASTNDNRYHFGTSRPRGLFIRKVFKNECVSDRKNFQQPTTSSIDPRRPCFLPSRHTGIGTRIGTGT